MTEQKRVLRFEVFPFDGGHWGTCALCGQKYEQEQYSAVVAIFDTEDNDFLGEACPSCIEAGNAKAKDRIDAHIERLVDQIKALRGLARDLDFTEWPTAGRVEDTLARFYVWRSPSHLCGPAGQDEQCEAPKPKRPADLFTTAGNEPIPF